MKHFIIYAQMCIPISQGQTSSIPFAYYNFARDKLEDYKESKARVSISLTTVDRRVGNEYTLFNMVFTSGSIQFVAVYPILIEIVLFTGRGDDKPGWSLHWSVRLQRRHPQPSAVGPNEHFTPLLHLYLWTQF